jgi:hypothetical protein
VADVVAQVEQIGRLRRFFSPAQADAIVGGGLEDPLKSRRRETAVVFLDLRRFTAFTESADPEEVSLPHWATIVTEPAGELALKGLARLVKVARAWKEPT